MDLAEGIRAALHSGGADIVGFANLCELPADSRRNLPFAISVGVACNPQIIDEISEGPTHRYYAEYQRINELLLLLVQSARQILIDRDYKAITLHPSDGEDMDTLSTPLPHKTVATRAGLGWIGKCALLVTEGFGSAVRFNTILTDAILPAGQPVNTSSCGECTVCANVCPCQAISGNDWQAGTPREALVDAHACKKTARTTCMENLGVSASICGLCIAACPWTKKYISEAVA